MSLQKQQSSPTSELPDFTVQQGTQHIQRELGKGHYFKHIEYNTERRLHCKIYLNQLHLYRYKPK